jgi:hypothetical protein
VLVICTGVTVAAIVMLRALVAVCAGDEESVAFTVKEYDPACVGVPPICPEAAFKLNPVGKLPEESDHE